MSLGCDPDEVKAAASSGRARDVDRARAFFLAVRRVVLVLFLSLMVASPTPAQACHWYEVCEGDVTSDMFNTAIQKISNTITDVGNWAKKTALGQIVNLFSSLADKASDLMNMFDDWKREGASAEIAADIGYAEIGIRQTDAQIQANTHDHAGVLAAKTAMESGVSGGGTDQFLCNVIKTRQAIPVMYDFVRMVERIIAQGIDATYMLGKSGPKFFYDDVMGRCGQVDGIKRGPPEQNLPEACRAAISLPGTSMADFDSTATSLSRTQVYTLPPLKKIEREVGGVKKEFYIFNPESGSDQITDSMKRWMVAAEYCYLVAGFRPAPPPIAEQMTSAGLHKTDLITQCRAQQEMFTSECAHRLATLTRPNCEDPDMAAFCVPAQEACLAGRTAGLQLGPEYVSCINGLNLYQLENVSTQLCGATQRILSDKLGGAADSAILQTIAQCSAHRSKWKQKIDTEDESYHKALEALGNVQKCFEKANQLPE